MPAPKEDFFFLPLLYRWMANLQLWRISGYLLVFLGVSLSSSIATLQAQLILSNLPLQRGFGKIPLVSTRTLSNWEIPAVQQPATIQAFCSKLQPFFRKHRWKENPCGTVEWRTHYRSTQYNPMLYAEFGTGSNTTLFLGGVHPDELTPIHLSFRLAQHLHDHPELYRNQDIRIIVAPLVNPDGAFASPPTRTNRTIDVNRNFLTLDWYEKAHTSWQKKNHMPRFFPGFFPNSEIETQFQIFLMNTYQPTKILSMHAPLGFYDYDGPDEAPKPGAPREFIYTVAKKSNNYRVVNYAIFPGSLGNFAGYERKVPTITLELETNDTTKVYAYWKQFFPGFLHSIQHAFSSPVLSLRK